MTLDNFKAILAEHRDAEHKDGLLITAYMARLADIERLTTENARLRAELLAAIRESGTEKRRP